MSAGSLYAESNPIGKRANESSHHSEREHGPSFGRIFGASIASRVVPAIIRAHGGSGVIVFDAESGGRRSAAAPERPVNGQACISHP